MYWANKFGFIVKNHQTTRPIGGRCLRKFQTIWSAVCSSHVYILKCNCLAPAQSRPVARGGAGRGRSPPKNFFAPLENVLDIVWKYWTQQKKFRPLSDNSSPLLLSQAGYGPGTKANKLESHFSWQGHSSRAGSGIGYKITELDVACFPYRVLHLVCPLRRAIDDGIQQLLGSGHKWFARLQLPLLLISWLGECGVVKVSGFKRVSCTRQWGSFVVEINTTDACSVKAGKLCSLEVSSCNLECVIAGWMKGGRYVHSNTKQERSTVVEWAGAVAVSEMSTRLDSDYNDFIEFGLDPDC